MRSLASVYQLKSILLLWIERWDVSASWDETHLRFTNNLLRVSSCTSSSGLCWLCECVYHRYESRGDGVTAEQHYLLCGKSRCASGPNCLIGGQGSREKCRQEVEGRQTMENHFGNNGSRLFVYESFTRRRTNKHIPPGTRALDRGACSCSIIVCQHSIQLSKAKQWVNENLDTWTNWHKQEKKRRCRECWQRQELLAFFFSISHIQGPWKQMYCVWQYTICMNTNKSDQLESKSVQWLLDEGFRLLLTVQTVNVNRSKSPLRLKWWRGRRMRT